MTDWPLWLRNNLLIGREGHGVSWNLLFGIVLDTIWWKRNTTIFQGEKWSAKVVIKKACNMAHSYKDRLMNFESLAKFGHINSNRLNIIWEFPVVDEVVLNCYSSVIENGRMSTCGGVVCDHTRFYFRIHLEFGRNFSPCSRVEGYIIGTKTSLVKRIQENKSGL